MLVDETKEVELGSINALGEAADDADVTDRVYVVYSCYLDILSDIKSMSSFGYAHTLIRSRGFRADVDASLAVDLLQRHLYLKANESFMRTVRPGRGHFLVACSLPWYLKMT